MEPLPNPVRTRRRQCSAWLVATAFAASLAPLNAAAQTAATTSASAAPKVRLSTSMGDVVLELYPDKAPKTVENFLQYVRDKHYDGTVFHRVISNFMVQGGGFDANYQQKPTRAPIAHEGQAALARGGPRNQTGTVAMARTNDPHSATAQFFINVKDNAFLDPTPIPPGDPVPRFEYRGQVYENVARANLVAAAELYGYTVFGKVIAGMDVVNQIKDTPTGAGGPFQTDVPKTPITILKATLEK
jgi:peptidyl-prolyl cis-trans isomerase A (cyclophilin A)